MLLVIEKMTSIPRKSGAMDTRYKCLCDCGIETIIYGSHLRNGSKIVGCGCQRKLPKGESACQILYQQYKKQAVVGEREFDITYEYFKIITKEKCHYCGIDPIGIRATKAGNGSYIFNGIDRVDNAIGYIEGNIVPCCKMCNYGKKAYSKNDFLNWVSNIYNYSILQPQIDNMVAPTKKQTT